jgi:hypothetical protein
MKILAFFLENFKHRYLKFSPFMRSIFCKIKHSFKGPWGNFKDLGLIKSNKIDRIEENKEFKHLFSIDCRIYGVHGFKINFLI